jgi:hypothetical protein
MRYPSLETIRARITSQSNLAKPVIDFVKDLRREFPDPQGNHLGIIPPNI